MPQYQGVWTLEQQAQAQSNQQWVTDPNFKNTTLLLQADGTGSGSQNQTFLDGSTNNFFITRNGNTTQGSFSPFSQAPGYWSNYFDGNSFFRTAANPNLAFGTGAITFECWINTLSASNMGMWGSTNEAAWTANSYAFNYYNGAILLWNNTTLWSISVGNLQDGNWHHIAIVRSGTTWQVFADGVSKGTTTTEGTRDLGNNTWRVGVGNTEPSGGATEKFNGYISNMRVSNTALYTANFIPTTSPLTTTSQGVSSSNVKFLSCQSNYFLDNSTNATTFTTNPSYGTPSVQAFGPFAPALQWTPDVVGGSGYFDGTGDYLSAGTNSAFAFGTGDFTIECWIYLTGANANYRTIVSTRGSAGSANGWTLATDANGNIYIYSNAFIVQASSAIVPNTWYHVAVCRASGTTTLYLNGVSKATSATAKDYTDSGLAISNDPYLSSELWQGYIAGLRLVKGTAVYTSAFTPPTVPPTAITNTQLLLNYTNAGIYDGKMANNLETVGNARVSTSPVKYGSGSIYLDGTGDWLLTPNGKSFINGTEPFTFECWVYLTGTPNYWTLCGGGSGSFLLTLQTLTTININPYGSGNTLSVTTSLSTNTWIHIAATRNAANKIDIWVNGVSAGSTTSTQSFGSPTYYVIGAADSGGTQPFNGYIDDLRITKDCRYFTTFTPPQQALPRQ